ncbi:hypothetical protein SC1_00731 [Sphingopyxis sp. C-1]|nr:hypothetical protein SC1_00731 [Sphingopyxis sp. C-1]
MEPRLPRPSRRPLAGRGAGPHRKGARPPRGRSASEGWRAKAILIRDAKGRSPGGK